MITHSSSASQQQESFNQVVTHLKEQGIRLTETRKAVISYMINSQSHPSAEMIYKDLLPFHPTMSLATVYNNLKLLLEAGFVTELKRSNDNTTYYDFMGQEHLNIICERCGTITDVSDQQLSQFIQKVSEETGYRITKDVLSLYGICPSCQVG